MHTSHILDRHARWAPTRAAVRQGERSVDYRELQQRSRRAAHALQGLGVRHGGRVAVLASNCLEYVELVFAAGLAGAAFVPLNFRLSAEELQYILADAGCETLVYTADLRTTVEALREMTTPVKRWVSIGDHAGATDRYDDLLARASASELSTPVAGSDLFTIMYTSGTTGRPKGVMLSQNAFMRGTAHFALALRAAPWDVNLQLTPQFHAGGQIYQLAHVLVGATTVVAPRFEPEPVLRQIESLGVTAVGFVPTMLVELLESPALARTDFSRLQRVFYGAAPIAEDRLALAIERLGAGFQQTYGQTESGVIVTLLDTDEHLRGLRESRGVLQSCGRAIAGYDVRVVDDAGSDVAVGDIGEIIVRGESLMDGYLNLPEATAKCLRDGWLYTGDLARIDETGLVYVVDRRNDLIISGGENIYPIEVEHVISSHPAVLDVAVIGVPDEKWGEAVKAIVSLRPGHAFDEASIRQWCRVRLGGFKVPKTVDVIDQVPRNASGKLLKKQLRDPYWAGHSRRI